MNKALFVIDCQKYFLTPKTKKVVKKIYDFLKNNIQKYDVVYFTIFKNDPKSPLWSISGWRECSQSPDTDLFDELKKFITKDNLVYKNILSAAKLPRIKEALITKEIKEVDICGFDTDCCILATIYDLFDLGIKPVILEDLTWSTSKEKLHKPALKMIKRNVGFIRKACPFFA